MREYVSFMSDMESIVNGARPFICRANWQRRHTWSQLKTMLQLSYSSASVWRTRNLYIWCYKLAQHRCAQSGCSLLAKSKLWITVTTVCNVVTRATAILLQLCQHMDDPLMAHGNALKELKKRVECVHVEKSTLEDTRQDQCQRITESHLEKPKKKKRKMK